MKQDKEYQSLVRRLEQAAEAANQILRKYPPELINAFLKGPFDEIIDVLKDSSDKSLKAKHFEASYLREQMIATHMIVEDLRQLDKVPDLSGIPPLHLHIANVMYHLGFCHSTLIKAQLIATDEAKALFQSLAGAKDIAKRWEEDKEDYKSAEVEAVEYYETGGTDTHEKVAKRLAKKYNVSNNTLRGNIKPIARKYGKVRGEKKSAFK